MGPPSSPFAKNCVVPFTHDLFRDFYLKDAKGNFLISPSSIYSALFMLLPGAAEETKSKLSKAVRAENRDNVAAIAESLGGYLQAMIEGDVNQTLLQTNGIFINKGSNIKQAFCYTVETYFKAHSKELDFSGDPEGSRTSINQWISDDTKGKIKELLPKQSITSLTRFVLVNALYFKGSWKSKFDKSVTNHDGIFHSLSDGDIKASMMRQKARFPMADFVDIGAQALKIPFQCHQMLVVLPEKEDGFVDLIKELSEKPASFIEVVTSDQYFETEVILTLPKFSLGGDSMMLKKPLQDMGLSCIFEAEDADFSEMSEEKPLYISDVYHQAVIEVNEEGAEAAAATAAVLMTRAMPQRPLEFLVNRPFVFFITTESGIPIFMGRVVKPEAKKL